MLGGFSMGAVMSYALGLGRDRPVPGGVAAFSGFIPTTEGWQPGLEQRRGLPVFISHGTRDAVISVEFAREAQRRLLDAGLAVSYHEFESSHHIDPRHLPLAAEWLSQTPRGGRRARKRIRFLAGEGRERASKDRERASMLQAASGANGGPPTRELEVIIIGAGFGGVAAAIELRRHGIRSVRILEKASDLGGTWYYNSYPGSACDVPSHLYSFSYAQRRDWSRLCSLQAGDPLLPARRRPRPRHRAADQDRTPPSAAARGTSSAAAGRCTTARATATSPTRS